MLVERKIFVMHNIKKYLDELSVLVRLIDKASPILVDSGRARIARELLNNLAKKVFSSLPEVHQSKFHQSYSIGHGSFPKILWVALTPIGKRVSNSISVTTCFSRDGIGIVAGVMVPNMHRIQIPTVRRSILAKYLNINGGSGRTHYNNRFINPMEFYFDSFDEKAYLAHVAESLELALELLNIFLPNKERHK